jgi:hypothetical protein
MKGGNSMLKSISMDIHSLLITDQYVIEVALMSSKVFAEEVRKYD